MNDLVIGDLKFATDSAFADWVSKHDRLNDMADAEGITFDRHGVLREFCFPEKNEAITYYLAICSEIGAAIGEAYESEDFDITEAYLEGRKDFNEAIVKSLDADLALLRGHPEVEQEQLSLIPADDAYGWIRSFGSVIESVGYSLDLLDDLTVNRAMLAFTRGYYDGKIIEGPRSAARKSYRNGFCQRSHGSARRNEMERNGMTHGEVDHPAHYNNGKIEVIDVIEDWGLGFHLGNAIKYIARAGHKDPAKTEEDLKKAMWYINRFIKLEWRT